VFVLFPEYEDTGTRLIEFLGFGKVGLMKRANVSVSEVDFCDNLIALMLFIDS
jgi:hypothetical protein